MIYILANARTVSGGPELMHQLCSELQKDNFDASMFYFSKFKFGTEKTGELLRERYGKYNCLISKKINDVETNTVVFPETTLYFLPRVKKAKRVIWWMSVDNYYSSWNSPYAKLFAPTGINAAKFNPFADNIYHCYQSEYARLFLLEHGVDASKIMPLSDYINDEIIEKGIENRNKRERKNIVLYNPKKGFEYTSKLIEKCPQLEWVALEGFSPAGLAEIMSKAKVYIDFGNHPGKDRIPREAAVNGCIVLVGKRGAAINEIDVPLDDKYKVDMEEFDAESISKRLVDLCDMYDDSVSDFQAYIKSISSEKETFKKECLDFGRFFSKKWEV